MRFLVSEADVLEERELHNGCTLDLSIYKRDENIPSAPKEKVSRYTVHPGTLGSTLEVLGLQRVRLIPRFST